MMTLSPLPGLFLLHSWRRNRSPRNRCLLFVVTVLFCNGLAVAASAQQQEAPEDPEDEKQVGLWLDQGISADLSPDKSLEFEFHERFDEGASNLFEYFFQGGVALRLRPWLTVTPIYRYQRFPANPTIAYENRLQLNLTLSTSRGRGGLTFARSSKAAFPIIATPQHVFDFVRVSTIRYCYG